MLDLSVGNFVRAMHNSFSFQPGYVRQARASVPQVRLAFCRKQAGQRVAAEKLTTTIRDDAYNGQVSVQRWTGRFQRSKTPVQRPGELTRLPLHGHSMSDQRIVVQSCN